MFRKIVLLCLALLFVVTTSYAATREFQEGDAGKEITEIQLKLKEQGYYRDTIHGKFTKETKKAVMAFQKVKKLEVDGIVGKKTYFALTGKNLMDNSTESKNENKGNKAEKITSSAMQLVGTPYKWGGVTAKGFDCSGMVWYVFDKNAITLPRTADVQYQAGKAVGKNQLQQGDLVFFTTYEPGPSHSGIYLEKGKFIHTSSSRGVMVSNLSDEYWNTRYLGARRII